MICSDMLSLAIDFSVTLARYGQEPLDTEKRPLLIRQKRTPVR